MLRPLNRPAAALALAAAILLSALPSPADETKTESAATSAPNVELALPDSPSRVREDVAFLASDALGGREPGWPGLEVAAEYIASRFAAMGLEPAGDGDGYFDWFDIPYGADFAGRHGAVIRWSGGGERILGGWTEAFPLGFGATPDEVDAPVVFAGFGVAPSPEERKRGVKYDDWEGVDVEGKIVLLLRFVPRGPGDEAPLGGARSPHAPLAAKIAEAKRRGAVGVLFVTPPGHPQSGAEIESIENLQGYARRAAPRHPTLPALILPTAVGVELLASAGEDLESVATKIDRELTPRSFPLSGVRARFATSRARKAVRNVVARLPGAGELADETIVIGAHYDHIGRYGAQVRPPHFGKVHNGADDNASGVAGVLELARIFAAGAPSLGENRRSLLFLLFSAEEIGLVGSRHWVDAERHYRLKTASWLASSPPQGEAAGAHGHGSAPPHGTAGSETTSGATAGRRLPSGALVVGSGSPEGGSLPVTWPPTGVEGWVPLEHLEQIAGPTPLDRIACMVNLDMIGQPKDPPSVSVIGGDSSPVFEPLLAPAAEKAGLALRFGGGLGGGGSDHSSFLRHDIPVLFFFTGMHRRYNTPGDDTETVSFEGIERITRLVSGCVAELAVRPEAPPFDPKTALTKRSAHGKPKLGVMLGPAEEGTRGARVRGVTQDTPAAAAGLEPGDLIVRFGDVQIRSVRDLIRAVGDAEAGTEVAIRVHREDGELTLTAEFPKPKGFRVSFGSVPDYTYDERGVKFDDIRPDTAAAAAGVKPGDVLIEWGGKEVEDVSHWTRFLTQHAPGDVVKIKVRRGEETLELDVKLKAR